MRILQTLVLALVLALTSTPPAAAGERPFVHQGVAKDAERYEAFLKTNWKPAKGKATELKASGDKVLAADPRAASRHFASAVATDDRDADAWIGLAKALLSITPDPNNGAERYDLPVNASGAAYRAYERAKDAPQKARALAVLGDAMAKRSYWRPAIDALKESLALADDAAVRVNYDKLRAEHGFRMTDYKTETEAQSPRVCLQFSETVARGQADLAKFVSVNGADPQGVSGEGQQLCIDGLAHGQRYEIKVRAGLPSDVGEALEKPIEIATYVPDRKPQVRFTGRSYVLPSRGQQGIPVITLNTAKIEVEVYRIGDRSLAAAIQNGDLARQLSGYDAAEIKDSKGEKVYAGVMDTASKLNEDVTTAIPVTDATGPLKPGAYVMLAKPAEKQGETYDEQATQWFIVSDLGLTAFTGADGLHAFVRSLADANAATKAQVKLVARNNEVLATAATDDKGYAKFDAGVARGEGGLQPALLVAENGNGEYAFLDLTTAAFDLSDRGVKGREAPGPLDGYLYTERGVYRPGETVNITGLVRDRAGLAATLPVTLIVSRPDGVEHTRTTLSDQGLGGRATALDLGAGVMTGTWRLWLHADPKGPHISQATFLVEDFVPERLDLTLDAESKSIAPEETAKINAAGRYLYGPPAADLALEGEIVVKLSSKDVEGFAGYRFGLADEKVNPVRKALDVTATTGADGKAVLDVTLPQIPRTAKPLEADVIIKLRETGGRTIERIVTLPIDMKAPRIGVKPAFANGNVPENENARFDVVLLDAGGKPATGTLNWTLNRLDTHWQWYRRDGSWAYEAVTLTRKSGSGTATLSADGHAVIDSKVDYGRYRLDVVSSEPSGPAASVLFNAGWYTGASTEESPEILDVALDKPAYKPGDTAKLRIATKHGGKALITVLGASVHAMQEVEIAKGGGDVEIPVTDAWGAGAYATALLYRPMDETAKRMPSRAIGIKWLALDQTDAKLKVTLNAPDKIRSASKLTIPVKIEGLKSGEDARITVAAVDAGILNLTRFEAPAPENWFLAQQKLGLEIRDFYGRLIDGMHAERGTLRSGGDGPSGAMTLPGAPSVETIVSLYSGIVKVRPDGSAMVEFDVPDFNGTLRLMAVAWSAGKVGHGTADTIVRDPIALTVSAPRFLTLGDDARIGLDLHNVDGAEAAYDIAVTRDTESLLKRATALKTGERKREQLTIKPADVGPMTVKVAVTGPQAVTIARELTFDVKPPAGDIKRTTVSSLAAKGGKITLSPDLVHDLIASRTRINLSVGPAATLDVPGLLTALDRYPYGCAEQTVSRALPLVYANAVAEQIGIAPDKELKARVQKAVDRVFEMQDASGAFGIWGPYNADLWLTSYVTDFLTRAKETGYTLKQQGFTQALDRLSNFVNNAGDFEKGGETHAYALYVLARNGRAPAGELRYWADTRLDRFATPLAKAQLGAALAMVGDKERSEKAFTAAMAALDAKEDVSIYRADYGSHLRDGAALVTLASETGMAKVEAPKLVSVIAKAYLARSYTSTQEQAWMLMAAKALGDEAKQTRLFLNGKAVIGSVNRAFTSGDLGSKSVIVSNEGEAAVDAVVSVVGAALTPEPATSKGFKIVRTFYTLDGKKVDLVSANGGAETVQQNDRFIAVVKVDAMQSGGRVLVVDRLPAGFEIENPRLVESGDTKNLDVVQSALKPEHTEFRDDRFVAAFNFSASATQQNGEASENDNAQSTENDSEAETEGSAVATDNSTAQAPAASATVAYIVRAVTPGTFVHPAATVEDMYRPERYARSAAGTLTVTAKE